MFEKEIKIKMLKNRVNRLNANPAINSAIIKKIQRQIRKLEK